MGYEVTHKKDVQIDRAKLKFLLDKKGWDYIQFHEKLQNEYGLDIKYKGFMHLLANKPTWKLIYAYAIIDMLGVNLNELFVLVDVDVEAVKMKKERMKEKYSKD